MLTGQFRASFVHVFSPNTKNTDNPKYSVTMLIPKSDINTINQINAEIERAKQEGISTLGGKIPPGLKTPLHDGDGLRPNGDEFGEECKGHYVMTASSLNKPVVVDINTQDIINSSDFYSGCYARANIRFYAYNQNGNKGIACYLDGVQKLADGEPLTTRPTATEMFAGQNTWTGVAAAPSYPAQQPPAYPQQPIPQAPAYPQQPAPAYQAPQPAGYPQQPAVPAAGYPAAPMTAPGYQQAAPAYPQQVPQQRIDPVTGQPMTGGVMGL